MGTTFEDDDQDYGSGFGLFVNNPLFSDVSLRLSDERSFAGHRWVQNYHYPPPCHRATTPPSPRAISPPSLPPPSSQGFY
mmetsp:Transcript_44832/g.122602  ORF Transcript_44832/g.122602 Transcript_44832/m.122602 type:complete len:80 (-) Transcript_44832:905-1144(-)